MTLNDWNEVPGWMENICGKGKVKAYWIDGDVCEKPMYGSA